MKLQPMVVVAALGALICGTAYSQQGGEPDELEELQLLVEEQGTRIDQLQEELAEARLLLDDTVAYVNAQATSGQDMLAVFTSAEDKGYTAGINFESRKVLLAGWRKYIGGMKSGLPGKAAEAKGKK